MPCPSCRCTKRTLEEEHPLPLVAAGAVAILRAARATLPLRPPDPLQVVDLHDEENRDRDKDLRLAHLPLTIASWRGRLKGRSAYFARRRGLGAQRPQPE